LPYKRLKARGITFVFKYEPDNPDLLHIYVRHLKEPDDAIEIFFQGEKRWNVEQDLWESQLGNERMWWFWINEADRVVMVVTCFDEE
jgi:hypothetical protein